MWVVKSTDILLNQTDTESKFLNIKPKQNKTPQVLISAGCCLWPFFVANIVGSIREYLLNADPWDQSPSVKVFGRGLFLLSS